MRCGLIRPDISKAVLNHHFDTVPTKYIADVFKMNPNYYQAFFAIDKAVREHDGSSHTPYVKLKHRRNSTVVPSHLIRGLEAGGHDFESLKEEMRSAERRWQKEEGKIFEYRISRSNRGHCSRYISYSSSPYF